jgi:ABC-2 type transport system permease protein
VRTTQNLLFHYFSIWLMPLSIFGLGLALPLLVTRDLASNAIVVYASKAVSRGDYFLGKFATAFGLLCLTWLGPISAAWLVGNLLAPDWRFFWHARIALGHTLLFGLPMMGLLSVLALGVSAISSKEKATPALWFMWWIFGGVLAPIARHTQPWLRHLSFNFNLDQLALALFHPGKDLEVAQPSIPILGEMVRNIRPATMAALNEPATLAAALTLLSLAAVAALILNRRVKPE